MAGSLKNWGDKLRFPEPSADLHQGLFAYFARHRTAANILMMMALLAGLYATLNIRTLFFPDVEINSVRIAVEWEGAPSADVDESLVRPLQQELRLVDGVDTVTGIAREGRANLTVTFQEGYDLEIGKRDVESALTETNSLPEGAEDPELVTVRFLDNVSRIVFSADGDLSYLINRAEYLQSELYNAGLEEITITGLRSPTVDIELNPVRMRELELTPSDIASALRSETQDSPGGEIEGGARTLRVEATRTTVREFENLTIKRLADGTRISLREVATVSKGYPGDTVQQFRNSRGAVELIVQRGTNGDTVRQQVVVEEFIAGLNRTLAEGVTVENYAIEADAIRARINILVENGIYGSLIVFVLLLIFLNMRVAFWVAVGIPVSIAATLAVMYFSGQTLNMISMFALIVSLGIIVDDALVVGEHAYELKSRGYKPEEAAVAASKRMLGPVFAAAATTIIAFASLMLTGGRFGSIISVMPLAVIAVVTASLIECFLILPAHMRHALAARKPRNRHIGVRVREAIDRGVDWVRYRMFPPIVRGVVYVRYPFVTGLFVIVLLAIGFVQNGTVSYTFFSFPESNAVTSNLTMAETARREDTIAMLDEMESAVARTLEEIGKNPDTPTSIDDVVMVLTSYGLHQSFRGYSTPDTPTQRVGSIRIELVDSDQRSFSTFDFSEAWSAAINRSPLVEDISSRGGRRGSNNSDGVTLALIGEDVNLLKEAALEVQRAAAEIDIISEVDDNTEYADPEIEFTLSPLGEQLGFDAARIGTELRALISEVEATNFVENGEEVEVRVFLPEEDRTLMSLRRQEIKAPNGSLVPLKEIVNIGENVGFRAIRSEDSDRQVTVSMTYDEEATTAAEVAQTVEAGILPNVQGLYDFDYRFGGDLADERETMLDLQIAAFACLAGIYLIIAWVFGSFVRPIVILLVVPFGIVGAVLGHWAHDTTATVFSAIGLVGLSGIIVNDSIVLVSVIEERRKTQPLMEALVYGTADRLRAVFLTSLTTVGGLTPLLFEQSRQALFLKPTVITITWGLGIGTLLLLLFVPAAIAIQADIARHLNRTRVLMAWAGGRRSRFARSDENQEAG